MIKKLFPILVCALLAGLLVWTAHLFLFSIFMLYDDEGYVLISLRDFGLHGSLYNQVYSQYGPAFYLGYDALHRLLGFAWTNTNGRWLTLVNWSGTAFFCALLVRRARGSWPLTLCVLAQGFSFLWIMSREPMHPGSIITLMVAAAAWLGWEMLRAGRINAFALIMGIAGSLLALIKINVGAFMILSTVFWFVLSLPSDQSRYPRWLLSALGLLLPVVLMRMLLTDDWAQIFAALAGLSIVGTVLAASPMARLNPATPRTWALFIGSGLAVAGVVALLMLPRGTDLHELLHGVILAPLKHPGIYAFGPLWRTGALWTAFGVVALLALATRRPDDERLNQALAWIRIIATTSYVMLALRDQDVSHGILGLSYGVPLAGLFAWPLDRKTPGAIASSQARAWLALLLVFQCLHAFPVAGSQLNWGTFLWVPLMALGFEEALRVATVSFPAKITSLVRGTILVLLTLLCVQITKGFVQLAHFAREGGEPLEQPGAEQIYMPANFSSSLRVLAENTRNHGDMLLSLPGSYSLNLWSGVDTPTLANVTHWFSLLDDTQQQAIIHRIEHAERPIFIVQHNILGDLMKAGFHPTGPLMDYLRTSFHRAFAIEGDSFWVRNGRSIAPLSTATLNLVKRQSNSMLNLELTLAPHAGKITSAELWVTVGLPWRRLTLDASQTSVASTPLNMDGTTAGPTRPAEWPWTIDQVSRITLTFPSPEHLPPPNVIEVILFDENHHRVAFARILPLNGFELPPAHKADPAQPLATP